MTVTAVRLLASRMLYGRLAPHDHERDLSRRLPCWKRWSACLWQWRLLGAPLLAASRRTWTIGTLVTLAVGVVVLAAWGAWPAMAWRLASPLLGYFFELQDGAHDRLLRGREVLYFTGASPEECVARPDLRHPSRPPDSAQHGRFVPNFPGTFSQWRSFRRSDQHHSVDSSMGCPGWSFQLTMRRLALAGEAGAEATTVVTVETFRVSSEIAGIRESGCDLHLLESDIQVTERAQV